MAAYKTDFDKNQKRSLNRDFMRGDDPGDQQLPQRTRPDSPWPGPAGFTRIGGTPKREPERREPRSLKNHPDSLRRGPI